MAQPLVIIEEHETDIKSFLPFVKHQNITNDRLVALSFRLRGPALTSVQMAYAQRSDLPFSGLFRPRLDSELATWIPVRNCVFFETTENFNRHRDAAGFLALQKVLVELRSLGRQPAAPLFLASRFLKQHAQYLYSPNHGILPLYEPGSSGVASIRVLEKVGRIIGVKMNVQGQAEAVCWAPLSKLLSNPRSLTLTKPWTDLMPLSGKSRVPFFSRAFGERDTRPEMILNLGPDLRIHFRFTSKTHTRMMAQFNMPWRVVGPPPISNPQTCLVYQVDGGGLEIESAPVTGNAPLASNLACTIQ